MQRDRPIGITIIAILMIISGIFFIIGGIGLTALSVLSLAFLAGGIGSIILGIASLVVAWGLLKGAGWAWSITLIITIISIIANIASLFWWKYCKYNRYNHRRYHNLLFVSS